MAEEGAEGYSCGGRCPNKNKQYEKGRFDLYICCWPELKGRLDPVDNKHVLVKVSLSGDFFKYKI